MSPRLQKVRLVSAFTYFFDSLSAPQSILAKTTLEGSSSLARRSSSGAIILQGPHLRSGKGRRSWPLVSCCQRAAQNANWIDALKQLMPGAHLQGNAPSLRHCLERPTVRSPGDRKNASQMLHAVNCPHDCSGMVLCARI